MTFFELELFTFFLENLSLSFIKDPSKHFARNQGLMTRFSLCVICKALPATFFCKASTDTDTHLSVYTGTRQG